MKTKIDEHSLLLSLCDEIYAAQQRAEDERKLQIFGGQLGPELLVMRKDKVRVEIRKENVPHHKPHMHITHSDKIDVSISLSDFSVLAGKINSTTKKHLFDILQPRQTQLMAIWNELNEKDNSIEAEKMISNLGL